MKRFRIRRVLATGAILLAALLTIGRADEMPKTAASNLEKAVFAGGCFWCMEPPFDKLAGVVSTTSGYIGGQTINPTYRDVSAGGTGHAEAIEILFDPKKIGYEKLIEVFWRNIDPASPDGQFCDRGDQYRSEIFYHNDEQRRLAERSKAALERSKTFREPIATKITPVSTFYPAEEYHTNSTDTTAAAING